MQESDPGKESVRGLKLHRILQHNWMAMPNTIWFVLLFAGSRIPMLFLGFGLDPDAWRIANSAYDIRHHFVYHASRFPGYPVPEFINGAIVDLGWLATNSLTMLLSLLSVLAFGRILNELECKDKGLLMIAYAFMPLVWINSTNTMDYMLSLSFIIFTWLCIIKGRYFSAGLMLALATGSRATAAAFVLPFLFLAHSRNATIKHIAIFTLTFLVASLLSFLPLYLTYGLRFIHHYPSHASIVYVGYQAIKYSGLPSLMLLCIILLTMLRTLPKLLAARDKNDLFILLSAITVLITFSFAPYHIEYVIPLIPFGLLLIWRAGKRILFVLFCCTILLHSFISVGSIQHMDGGRLAVRALDSGAVYKNFMARKAQMAFARKLADIDLPEHSVVIIGTWLPILAHLDDDLSSSSATKRMFDSNQPRAGVWDFQKDIWYRYLIGLDELQHLQRENYLTFYVKGIRAFTLDTYGYDLNDYGAVLIDM